MKVTDFLKTFNFHDSLLEHCTYKTDSKELLFEIDFCYWVQEDYKEGFDENGIVKVLFTGVSDFKYDEYDICSDSILNFVINKAGKIELTVETDDGDIHTFSFLSDSVEMYK